MEHGITRWTKLLNGRNRGRVPVGQESQADLTRLAIGAVHSRLISQETFDDLRDAEFKVFSQEGEDGMIQYLVQRLPNRDGTFVEIGVEDYSESNTRFLLTHNGWRGLAIDGDDAHSAFVTSTGLRWRRHIDAVSAFVTAENVNAVISAAGFAGEIDLFSLDIDGNDYWVLDKLSAVRPKIIIVEYNSLFGSRHSVSIPYMPDFRRQQAHPSFLYYGASLPALAQLLQRKGFRLIGTSSSGNNAFFLRQDIDTTLAELTAEDAFQPTRFREARDDRGNLSFRSADDQVLRSMAHLPVIETESGEQMLIREVYQLT